MVKSTQWKQFSSIQYYLKRSQSKIFQVFNITWRRFQWVNLSQAGRLIRSRWSLHWSRMSSGRTSSNRDCSQCSLYACSVHTHRLVPCICMCTGCTHIYWLTDVYTRCIYLWSREIYYSLRKYEIYGIFDIFDFMWSTYIHKIKW